MQAIRVLPPRNERKLGRVSQDRVTNFPDDSRAVFSTYVHLVYTNQPATQQQDKCQEYADLIDLYILSEKLGDTSAKNDIVTAIVSVAKEKLSNGNSCLPSITSVNKLYGGTPSESPASRLMVDTWSGASSVDLENILGKCQPEFVRDLVITLNRLRRSNCQKTGAHTYLQ